MGTKAKLLKDGFHVVTITSAGLGESANGNERFELQLKDEAGSTARRDLYLTPKARPYTEEILAEFGIDTSTDYVDEIGSLAGRGARVFIKTPTGGMPEVAKIWPLDEDRPRASQEELRARMKARLTEKEPTAPTPTVNEHEIEEGS